MAWTARNHVWSCHGANAFGDPDRLVVTPHDCHMALGRSARARQAAYRTMFEEEPPHETIETLRDGNGSPSPTGDARSPIVPSAGGAPDAAAAVAAMLAFEGVRGVTDADVAEWIAEGGGQTATGTSPVRFGERVSLEKSGDDRSLEPAIGRAARCRARAPA